VSLGKNFCSLFVTPCKPIHFCKLKMKFFKQFVNFSHYWFLTPFRIPNGRTLRLCLDSFENKSRRLKRERVEKFFILFSFCRTLFLATSLFQSHLDNLEQTSRALTISFLTFLFHSISYFMKRDVVYFYNQFLGLCQQEEGG